MTEKMFLFVAHVPDTSEEEADLQREKENQHKEQINQIYRDIQNIKDEKLYTFSQSLNELRIRFDVQTEEIKEKMDKQVNELTLKIDSIASKLEKMSSNGDAKIQNKQILNPAKSRSLISFEEENPKEITISKKKTGFI